MVWLAHPVLNKSDGQSNACAKFKRIRQPPEKDFTSLAFLSWLKPKRM